MLEEGEEEEGGRGAGRNDNSQDKDFTSTKIIIPPPVSTLAQDVRKLRMFARFASGRAPIFDNLASLSSFEMADKQHLHIGLAFAFRGVLVQMSFFI